MCILEKILEYIFLPKCGICEKLGEGYLCKDCLEELKKYAIIEKKILYNSSNILNKFEKIENNLEKVEIISKIEKMHIFRYEEKIRNLILQYKFNDKAYLYKTFCEFIVKNKKVFDFIKKYDIIIPVPIHKKRLKTRGYNQSELIAKELTKRTKLIFLKDVLVKKINNNAQSTLNKKEREENAKNVYKLINSEKIKNKDVLIFDDIYTTGATINSCIKELENVGVKNIGILTLAKD
mgnify:CR=1 FL=1